jgi:two-component system, OmpR family, sensor kinase
MIMMQPAQLPIRARVTAVFAAVMTMLLLGIGAFIHQSMASALLDEIDTGLRSRAESTLSTAHAGSVKVLDQGSLDEPGEAFAQVLSRSGRVMSCSDGLTAPLLARDQLARISRPTFIERPLTNAVGAARLLVLPVDSSSSSAVLVVGTALADRSDALMRLRQVMLLGGPAAIAAACLAGWLVAGLALHPIERLRQQAAAITASGLDRRLTVPSARDELRRLAQTLNDMLARLDQSFRSERDFIERASHELRTPLTALRAEVDLALSRPRSADELTLALYSVSQETDRLARLAEDLLVLARISNGRMPLHRQQIPLRDTLESAAALFTATALELGITVTTEAPDITINADPLRLRQALVNLLDNALRHTPRGGAVRLTGNITSTGACIAVSDTGPGLADTAADPHNYDSDWPHRQYSAGLGLRIVHAIAASHHGSLRIERNDDGGASVEIILPCAAMPYQQRATVATNEPVGRAPR